MIIQCKTGSYEIPHAVVEAYSALYPTAAQEFARMTIWLECNKAKRPANQKSAPRFVANWFKRVPKQVVRPRTERALIVEQLIGRQPFVFEGESIERS